MDIACSLDGPGMTDRLAEFRELFADALVGRDRTADGIRFRFRATDAIESRIRDLARRESECCPFFTFTITFAGGEVLWDASVPADAAPRPRRFLPTLRGCRFRVNLRSDGVAGMRRTSPGLDGSCLDAGGAP